MEATPEYSFREAVAVKLWVPTSVILVDNSFKSEPTLERNVETGEIA